MRTPRVIDQPQPGMWAVKLAKGGVDVAARIFRTSCPDCGAMLEPGVFPPNIAFRSPTLAAERDGKSVALDEVWLRRGREITETEYLKLLRDAARARQNAPHLPQANPTEPVDRSTLPLPF